MGPTDTKPPSAVSDLVEPGAGVEQVRAPFAPLPVGPQPVHHPGQQGGAVDHGCADDLAPALTGTPRAGHTAMPNASSRPPPPKSPTRLSGGTGLAGPADHREGCPRAPRELMSRPAAWASGPVWPSRSCGRRRAPVGGQAVVGARSPGARPPGEALDEAVGPLHQAQDEVASPGCLRSTPTERRPRHSRPRAGGARAVGSSATASARSTRSTSAPMSERASSPRTAPADARQLDDPAPASGPATVPPRRAHVGSRGAPEPRRALCYLAWRGR